MAALSLSINALRPLNRWDYDSIRPGVVGGVGDVNMSPRLKSTFPGDFRWEKEYEGKNESHVGSNVQDGYSYSYSSGGGGNKTIDSNWGGRRDFKTSHGWRYQDLRPSDLAIDPVLGEQPQFSWHQRIASVNHQQTSGNLFEFKGPLVIPPNGITRGGQFPRVTDSVGPGNDPGFDDLNGGFTRQNYINATKEGEYSYAPRIEMSAYKKSQNQKPISLSLGNRFRR